MLRKMVTKLGMREMAQHLTQYQPLPHYDSPANPAWRLMRAILAEWIRALDRPVVLMPLPLPQHLDETCDAAPYQARFAELALELGCRLHDPLPDLLRIPSATRRQLRWEKDIHFTPAGHDALAHSLQPVIADMLGAGLARAS
jgi:carbamoyltransferase